MTITGTQSDPSLVLDPFAPLPPFLLVFHSLPYTSSIQPPSTHLVHTAPFHKPGPYSPLPHTWSIQPPSTHLVHTAPFHIPGPYSPLPHTWSIQPPSTHLVHTAPFHKPGPYSPLPHTWSIQPPSTHLVHTAPFHTPRPYSPLPHTWSIQPPSTYLVHTAQSWHLTTRSFSRLAGTQSRVRDPPSPSCMPLLGSRQRSYFSGVLQTERERVKELCLELLS